MEASSGTIVNSNGQKAKGPAVYGYNRVTPLLGGEAYFRALGHALAQVGDEASAQGNRGHFIYVSGWLLNLVDQELPFDLPSPTGPVSMLELLKIKARAGVDVRVLAWLSWSLGMFGRLDVRYENLANIQTVRALRQEPALADKCCLILIGHPAGAVHAKVIVAGKPGWATGFTGGLDLSADGLAEPGPSTPPGTKGHPGHGRLPAAGASPTGIDACRASPGVAARSGKRIDRPGRRIQQAWVRARQDGAGRRLLGIDRLGSANLARRSLYTDVEHANAVVEPDGTWVQEHRAMLWGEHAGLAPGEQVILLDSRQPCYVPLNLV